MGFLPACISVHHMHAWFPRRPEEGLISSGIGVLRIKSWSSGRVGATSHPSKHLFNVEFFSFFSPPPRPPFLFNPGCFLPASPFNAQVLLALHESRGELGDPSTLYTVLFTFLPL